MRLVSILLQKNIPRAFVQKDVGSSGMLLYVVFILRSNVDLRNVRSVIGGDDRRNVGRYYLNVT